MRRGKPWAASIALFSASVLFPDLAFSRDPMLLHDADGFALRAHLEAGVNAVIEENLFWHLADTFAPDTDFDSDTTWLEFYAKPGLSFTKAFDSGVTAYGKISLVASGTLGTDAYDTGDTGRTTLEEGYLGLRALDGTGRSFDLSLGPREFKAGTGMLIANGGSSGFDRGALKLGPRKAWEKAALGRFAFGNFTGTAFYLDANEIIETDTTTSIAGGDFRYDGERETFAGVTYGHVLTSTAPYPKAAPGGIGPPAILPDAREGLNFVTLYGRANPFEQVLKNAFIAGDFAYEWNDDIDQEAWAGRVQLGYRFADLAWAPTITYAYQTFSGDDPSTARLERFDPLFYEGSPSSWSTGSKSSMVFINSNVNAHQFSLRVTPTERDTLTFRYAYINANELRSPIQFGQATRVDFSNGSPDLLAGVTAKHLADDFFLEYTRLINPHTYLTAGFSISVPGAGIDSLVNHHPPIWTGGFVNVVVSF